MGEIVGSGKGADELRHKSRFAGVVWKWIPAWWPWRIDIKVGRPRQCCSALVGKVLEHELRLGVSGYTHHKNSTGVGYMAAIYLGKEQIHSDFGMMPRDEQYLPTRLAAQDRAEDMLVDFVQAFQEVLNKAAEATDRKGGVGCTRNEGDE